MITFCNGTIRGGMTCYAPFGDGFGCSTSQDCVGMEDQRPSFISCLGK